MRSLRHLTWRRCALTAILAVCAAMLLAPGGSASHAFDCKFQSLQYPKLGRHSKPGTLYAVFIRRSLTCDDARATARRGTKTENPGPLRPFKMGPWSCLSFSPAFASKVIAGQCVQPGTRKLVNWSPVCEHGDNSCNTLRRR
jgi:hypothetical protein